MGFKNNNIARKLTLIFAAAIVICLNLVGCGHKYNPTAANNGIAEHISSETDEITYSIKYIIQREMFELSIHVPEDYPVEITDFEFWADNEKIGERTPVHKTLRHLTLSKDKTDKVNIKLYNNSELVADCEIDPQDEKGTLEISSLTDINIKKKMKK